MTENNVKNQGTEKEQTTVKPAGRKSLLSKALKLLIIFVASLVALAAAFIGILSLSEYKPEDIEELELTGSSQIKLMTNTPYNVLTYNIGYAALDSENDFFMDGGESVLGRSKEAVKNNLENITSIIENNSADVVFLQETDVKSKRSYRVNEYAYISEQLGGVSAFAYNYRCMYIPYPWPTLGKVNSGIVTVTSFNTESAERVALPVPFSWPLRICNLKRCLLVERIPVEGSDKYLVLVNLHLEAYDDGEGKAAQTAMLVSLLESEYAKGNYVIAGGDFNQTFPGVDTSDGKYKAVDEAYWQPGTLTEDILSEGWQFVYDDTTPTCRLLNAPYDAESDKTQYYVIDGFIVSANIKVNMATTRDTGFLYTDHNPVFMNITLTEAND